MSFRRRLVIGLLVVSLLPLAVLAIGVRREMQTQVLTQSERRVATLATIITSDFAEAHAELGAVLDRIARALADDGRFRADALRGEAGGRGYVIDYAQGAMRAAGLSVLQIRDDSGRILSSGHFPGEFDRIDAELPDALDVATGATLVTLRTAAGSVTAAARLDSAIIAGRRFTIIGGRAVDSAFVERLAPSDEIGVVLRVPSGVVRSASPAGTSDSIGSASADVLRRIELPHIDATSTPLTRGTAELAIVRRVDDALELQQGIDRWIIAAVLLATAIAVFTALWLAGRLSRPMEDLAAAAATVDLDRLDVRFAAGRDDEIGVLSRRLGAMVERLRVSAARLREAERRATVGEIARQVNHDIKNGLAPIRNVVRHLTQVAQDDPAELPQIFTARKGTLESSISYLETLARNYARLSPTLAAGPTDLATIIADVVGSGTRGPVTVRTRTAPGLAPVLAEAVVLRRILENLVGNAVDSLEGKPGEVTVSAAPATTTKQAPGITQASLIRLTVEDTGRGMTEAELSRAFDDFYTTKPHGTGLGLSVVRRLVGDLGGALRIETEPGVGTRVEVDLPAASAAPGGNRPVPTASR